jgi:CheY-like chemotaxis protein
VFSDQDPRVFVVDDEHVIASTLAAILQMHGFSTKFFTCPLEALTDVEMPGISGIDLAIQMKAQFPTCKILLLSGQATTFDLLQRARAQGHNFDLLFKPIPPTEFLLEIGKRVSGAGTALVPYELAPVAGV